MSGIEEIVAALYLSRWAHLELSAEVRTARQSERSRGVSERRYGLILGGSGRYRVELLGEAGEGGEPWLELCDGQLCWVVTDGAVRQFEAACSAVPFTESLSPSWLLANFNLEVTGSAMVGGREGAAVIGRRRETSKSRLVLDLMPDLVTAVVDLELGILLRCERTGPGELLQVTEFSRVTLGAPELSGDGLFGPPPGTTVVAQSTWAGGSALPEPGLASSGLPVSGGQVNLLHRTVLGHQEFSADLREWSDNEAIVRAVRVLADGDDAGRFGVRRFLNSGPTGASNRTARLHVAMPGRYRIDPVVPSSGPARIVCDGQYQWRVYADRVTRRSAEPLPAGIALIIDPAWMLCGYRLSDEGTAVVAGRRGLRVRAVPVGEADEMRRAPLSGRPFWAEWAEAVIDVELGIALRQAWYYGDQPVLVTEFSRVTVGVDTATFQVHIPPGTRVLIDPGLLAELGMSPAGFALDVASRVMRDLLSRLGLRA